MRPGSVLLVALVTVAAGCPRATSVRPHVLMITIDTLRADHVSGYGYDRPTTPAIDALLGEGAAFLAASTPTPTTAPAHASLFTGAYPRTHGVVKNGVVLSPDRATLAEVLAAQGYRTGAVVSAFPLARRFGLARGFAHYDDTFDPVHASIDTREWEGLRLDEAFDRRAGATTDRALAWLAGARDDRPWLLWVHYYDVHAPYDPPPSFANLFRDPAPSGRLARAIAAYDGETRFVDENVARLVARVDALFGSRDVLVVLATDHGEGLMDHGWMEHGVHLYEELVRVVLAFRWPGRIPAGVRSTVPVSLVDVAPTVAALLEVPSAPLAAEGRDLSPELRGRPAGAARPIFFERRPYASRDRTRVPVPGPMHAVRDGRWKYIDAPEAERRELFDLAADPAETTNLRDAEPATTARLAALLRDWRNATPAAGAGTAPVGSEDAARLRALGYVE